MGGLAEHASTQANATSRRRTRPSIHAVIREHLLRCAFRLRLLFGLGHWVVDPNFSQESVQVVIFFDRGRGAYGLFLPSANGRLGLLLLLE